MNINVYTKVLKLFKDNPNYYLEKFIITHFSKFNWSNSSLILLKFEISYNSSSLIWCGELLLF